MGLAFAVSKKSPDSQTQHGCFLTDKDNRPLGFGYNGFPRGAKDDSCLPTVRPAKYPWMFHAEENAVANATSDLTNAIAYVTGECCNHCLYTLWQHGVTTIYIANRHGTHEMSDEDRWWAKEFITQTGMTIVKVTPNLSWLVDISQEISQETFQ